MKLKKLKLLLVIASLVACSSRPARAQVGDMLGLSPFWDWKTIETDHFRVTFPAPLLDQASRSAMYLEEAHSFLSKKLYWEPRYKVQVLVIDNADAANGLTTPIGRFGMVFMVTPPDNWFGTHYYDDWLRLLAIHEYTHFLNMDATRDIWDIARTIFGDVLLVNSAWPPWMLEGLAVYMETRFTRAGRGRSPYYEMILRSAVEAGVIDDSKFVTLDKINGTNPYFPYGDTPYVFGYELMNQVARTPIGARTADGVTVLEPGPASHPSEDALGEMSRRSSKRIPYFINGNLENISGKDWYAHWDALMKDAGERGRADLQKIRSLPVTRTTPITEGGQDTLAGAFSPDGKWLAYTQDSSDEESSLFLRDLSTGETKRVDEKTLGAMLAFSPDSKAVFLSSLRRYGKYDLFSEIGVYDIENDRLDYLTDGLRAKDPDVSRDGSNVAFTVVSGPSSHIAIAPLARDGSGRYHLGAVRALETSKLYDSANTPKFSPDGKRVYFTLHPIGKLEEDLMVADVATGEVRTLVSNGWMNRFPAVRSVAGADEVYFVSDATGVYNLYRYRVEKGSRPELLTNVTTGLIFPTFDAQGKLNANLFTYRGWDIVQVEPSVTPLDPHAITLSPPPAPPPAEEAMKPRPAETAKYDVQDYSIFPSILPRQWAPFFLLRQGSAYLGGQILGFDAVDRHRYVVAAAYDTLIKKADVFALYGNRSLGVDLAFSYELQSTGVVLGSNDSLVSYNRRWRFNFDAAYPFLWTYSSLTPILSAHAERTELIVPGANIQDDDVVSRSRYVPYFDARLVYTDAQRSRLAVTSEQGRYSEIGARYHLNSGDESGKGLIRDTEYLRTDFLIHHSVLVPTVAFSAANQLTLNYLDANVVVEGRTNRVINTLDPISLDQLPLRGYPFMTFYTKQAGLASLDYRFPIAQVFRGWGTNPAFLDQLTGFVFGESVIFPTRKSGSKTLPSTGGGLELRFEFFNQVPLTVSGQYHRGFREEDGGRGEVFVELGVQGLSF